MIEKLPCPLCGAAPQSKQQGIYWRIWCVQTGGMHMVEAHGRGKTPSEAYAEAVKKWNTRHEIKNA